MVVFFPVKIWQLSPCQNEHAEIAYPKPPKLRFRLSFSQVACTLSTRNQLIVVLDVMSFAASNFASGFFQSCASVCVAASTEAHTKMSCLMRGVMARLCNAREDSNFKVSGVGSCPDQIHLFDFKVRQPLVDAVISRFLKHAL